MSQSVRVELDLKVLGKLVEPTIRKHTARVAAACGEGFEGDVIWTDRPHGAVRAVTPKAKRANRKHNILLKALG